MNNQQVYNRNAMIYCSAIALGMLMVSTGASADEMGDGICKLVSILTGKWLFGFSILAILGGGVSVIFGAEMTDGLKKIATIISIIGIILASTSILTFAFSKFNGMAC
jgi:type IV secretory pathway VirB2 component (pilin)